MCGMWVMRAWFACACAHASVHYFIVGTGLALLLPAPRVTGATRHPAQRHQPPWRHGGFQQVQRDCLPPALPCTHGALALFSVCLYRVLRTKKATLL